MYRRSENKRNLYSFFKFAESALIKLWNRIYAEKDLSIVTKFDELHDIYFNSLKKWIESLNGLISQENGLADLSHGGLSEIISYPLRSFDVGRRISYTAYVCFLLKQYDQAREYVKLLIKVVKNNKAANTPLCEFNYNDIGLTLTVMHWAKEDAEAVEWLFDITDFLISHYKNFLRENRGIKSSSCAATIANSAKQALDFYIAYRSISTLSKPVLVLYSGVFVKGIII